jgi:FMN phosphatase YigB (HAD superfamily)
MIQPQAILFDFDCTLTDRSKSIQQFARCFAERLAAALEKRDVSVLAKAIEEADGLGYRPRVEVFTILLHTLPWQRKPGIDELAALWREEFPACTQPAAGLTWVLDQLRRMRACGLSRPGNSPS